MRCMNFIEEKGTGFQEVEKGQPQINHYNTYIGLRLFPKRVQFTRLVGRKLLTRSKWWRIFTDEDKLKIKIMPSEELHPQSRQLHEYISQAADCRYPTSTYTFNASLNLPKGIYMLESEEPDESIIFGKEA